MPDCECCDPDYIDEDPDDAYWNQFGYPRWAKLLNWEKKCRNFGE